MFSVVLVSQALLVPEVTLIVIGVRDRLTITTIGLAITGGSS